MKVYRYLSAEEYEKIINNQVEKLGNIFYGKELANNFRYKKDERYMHFFKHKESMKEMQQLYYKDGKDYYFCCFDIPFRVLVHGIGTGCYTASGYDVDCEYHREFIVPVKKFKAEWLKVAEFDKHKHNLIKIFKERQEKIERGEEVPEIIW